MKHLYILGLLLFSLSITGQEKLKFTNTDSINELINRKSDQKDFQGILQILNQKNKNDTSYVSTLISKSYYLMALERYDGAIAVIDSAMAIGESDKSSFFQNKGIAYFKQNKFDLSLKTFDEGLELYPLNYLLNYNKAVVLAEAGKTAEAVALLEKTIGLNPLYANSYIKLASMYYEQERPSQALMLYNLAMILDPDSENSFSRLKAVNEMFSSENSNKRTPGLSLSTDDKAFDEIDLIISNRIALNENYTINNDLNFALIKQNHALLQKVNEIKTKDKFWGERVLPFFSWIQDSEKFDAFSYTISFAIQNEDFKKIIEKNTSEVKVFYKEAAQKWAQLLMNDRPSLFSDKRISYDYSSDLKYVASFGKLIDTTKTGNWFYFDRNGRLSTAASYNDSEERIGNWKWYNDSFKVYEDINYDAGKKEGLYQLYHPNGQLSVKTYYNNNLLDGEYLQYNENGALIQRSNYIEGKRNGLSTSNFEVGERIPEYKIEYVNDEIQGDVLEFQANGKLYSEIPFANGKRNGTEKTYYLNGQVNNQLNNVDGLAQGIYKKFYLDGSLQEEGNYTDGELEGIVKTYYKDGTLQSESNYENNLLEGSYKFYDTDGKIYYNYTYKNGDVIDYRYYSKDGALIKEGKKRGGEFYYEGYAPNANLTSEGLYNVKGGKSGPWKYYSNNGFLTSEAQYEDNLVQDVYKEYYPDGSVSWTGNYVNDSLSGYSASYYHTGGISNQGYYEEGLKQGEWHSYYVDGSLMTKNYYHKGNLHGIQETYGIDRELITTTTYNRGKLISESVYDAQGNVFQTLDYVPALNDTLLKIKHYNDKTGIEISYVNGIKHGPYKTYYFDGTLETEGNYINGMQDGKWTYYFENGQPHMEMNYTLNDLNGAFTRYYESGAIEDKYYYSYGNSTGEWQSFYEDGTLYTSTQYVDDLEHGRKEFYSPTGKLQLIRFYNHGTLIGYSYLDTSGKEIPMIPIKNETGKITSYYDNGLVAREMEYLDGLNVDKYKSYSYDGQLLQEFDNILDQYQGIKTEYYLNGNIKKQQEYTLDEPNGFFKSYYENGTLKEEATFKNGLKTGTALYYDKSGKKIKSKTYFNGKVTDQQKF